MIQALFFNIFWGNIFHNKFIYSFSINIFLTGCLIEHQIKSIQHKTLKECCWNVAMLNIEILQYWSVNVLSMLYLYWFFYIVNVIAMLKQYWTNWITNWIFIHAERLQNDCKYISLHYCNIADRLRNVFAMLLQSRSIIKMFTFSKIAL